MGSAGSQRLICARSPTTLRGRLMWGSCHDVPSKSHGTGSSHGEQGMCDEPAAAHELRFDAFVAGCGIQFRGVS